ncbi:unnamed protein product [marine sediment metagenome]|uniref:Uncharacterized protein n=1 Tax=marine sediment metagenome TaxID=412755 RepID=X1F1P1_9ZZZZ
MNSVDSVNKADEPKDLIYNFLPMTLHTAQILKDTLNEAMSASGVA